MRDLPLKGIRVLEIGQLIAAPIAAQILADLGAEVVKLERPGRGDEYRHYGPAFLTDAAGERIDQSAGFFVANTNKRSIAVDFSTPRGQSLVKDLACQADVVIENFRAGTLDAYGLGRDALSAANPGIIYVSVSGYGRTGAAARLPGTDSAFQAISGLMSVTGDPDGLPQKSGAPVVDYVTALYTAIGVLGALFERTRSGAGQSVDLSLLDCSLALMSARAAEYFVTGTVPQRFGDRTTGAAPAQLFRCRDGYLNVQAGFDHHFSILCEKLGVPELAGDPRYATRDERTANVDALTAILEPIFAQDTVSEWYDLLREAQLICAPIYDVEQCYADPNVVERNMRRTLEHPVAGPVDMVASPIRYGRTPIHTYRPAPGLGQHSDEILGDWLALDADGIADLRSEAVLA